MIDRAIDAYSQTEPSYRDVKCQLMTTKDKPQTAVDWTGNPMPPIDLVLIAHCFKTFKVLKLVSAQLLINLPLPGFVVDNLGQVGNDFTRHQNGNSGVGAD